LPAGPPCRTGSVTGTAADPGAAGGGDTDSNSGPVFGTVVVSGTAVGLGGNAGNGTGGETEVAGELGLGSTVGCEWGAGKPPEGGPVSDTDPGLALLPGCGGDDCSTLGVGSAGSEEVNGESGLATGAVTVGANAEGGSVPPRCKNRQIPMPIARKPIKVITPMIHLAIPDLATAGLVESSGSSDGGRSVLIGSACGGTGGGSTALCGGSRAGSAGAGGNGSDSAVA
jgi:hypothetical protein